MLRKTAFSFSRLASGFERSGRSGLGNVAGFATRVAASKPPAKKPATPKAKKETTGVKPAVAPVKATSATGESSEKKKDAPKRPLSAYALFIKNEYPGIKEASPGKPFAEISKKLADLWKELPEDRRAEYLKEAEKSVAASKAVKKATGRPPNAYAVFAKETFKLVQEKNPNMGFTDVSKKVGQMWRTLPPLEKAARKDRYQKALEEFKSKNASSL